MIDKLKTVSFSGYRSDKAPHNLNDVKNKLADSILISINEGFDTFLVGMADGFDEIVTEIVFEIKQKYTKIKLIAAVPFEESPKYSQRYNDILYRVDDTVILSERYSKWPYLERNEYMINNSNLLICYYDGKIGSTEYTFEYAQKQGINIINIAPTDLAMIKTFNNTTDRVRDDLEKTFKGKTKISIAAACFSIYAYEELKMRLSKIDQLRFIFTSPTFVMEKVAKSKREFYIPRLTRERNLYGTDFEVRLRNELTQKAIAKECADWIRKKVTFKSNITSENMSGFINVESDTNKYTYMPINGFTTVDIGCEKGNNAYNMVTRPASPASSEFILLFDELWQNKDKLEDVTEEVIDNITNVYKENPAEYIYFVTLYNIFNEFLEDISEDVLPNESIGFKESKIWNMLYTFQKDAALAIINKLEKYNGCILADSVGLGKTFTALAVIKYYEKRNKDVLVLCPKKLSNNWLTYRGKYKNNPISEDKLRYDVLYHTDLSREYGRSGTIQDLSALEWDTYDLIVIDESHNFRNGGDMSGENNEKENRYLKLLNKVIRQGVNTKVLMLSATPVNNKFTDLRNQIALAYEGRPEIIDKKLNTSKSINDIFRNAQTAFNNWSKFPPEGRTTDRLLKMLDFDFFEVLDSVTIARSRKHIEKYYDTTDVGKFPTRKPPISLRPPLTDLSDAINYKQIFEYLMELSLSIYTPTNFVLPSKLDKYIDVSSKQKATFVTGREEGIRRLTAINLMKRMESSVYAFTLTLTRIKELMARTVEQINDFENSIKSTSKANTIELFDITNIDEFDDDDQNVNLFSVGNKVKIVLADMDYISWRKALVKDQEVLELLTLMISEITPEHDSKLQKLFDVIKNKIEKPINVGNKKIIIFTAFADTAEYLYDNVHKFAKDTFGMNTAMVTGSIEGRSTIPKLHADLNTVLTCFSPMSKDKALLLPGNKDEIDILIGTDCISEGQNLQDCDYLVNYDIHWNPVRIIQRFGRIDRIGSKNECIQLVNFWPDLTLDEYINLKARVETRMKIVDMVATGDDNVLSTEEKGDIEYRKQQLEKLQNEVVDIEEMSTSISIMDLGLNEFRLDLLSYIKDNPDIDKAPFGLHAVVSGDKKGALFVLKNVNSEVNVERKNQLHPFYMVYIGEDGDIISTHLQPKQTLDLMRFMTKGKSEPDMKICHAFNEETEDGRNMQKISSLLEQSISSVINVNAENDIDSFFKTGSTTALTNNINGLDDFELIAFMVVK